MAEIKFYRGLYSSYNHETHANGIYFATDKGIIKMNGVDYTHGVKDIVLSDSGDEYVITYTNDTTTTIAAASDDYTSAIEDKTLEVPVAVGGIAKGTKVSDLEGKTYAEIIDELLFPSVNPTHTNPSVSGFSLSSTTSPVELGSNVITVSAAGLNKGIWSTYNNSKAYAGDITSIVYDLSINGTSYNDINSLPSKYNSVGTQTYKATVNYGQGPIPVNNKGAEVASLRCPAGSVNATRTVNVTCPWYASTVTAGTLTKQSLISWNSTAGNMTTGQFTLMSHTADAPQTFKLPRKASEIQMYSTVSQKFDVVKLSEWTESSASESVNGVNHTYYTYVYNGANRGSVKLIVKF